MNLGFEKSNGGFRGFEGLGFSTNVGTPQNSNFELWEVIFFFSGLSTEKREKLGEKYPKNIPIVPDLTLKCQDLFPKKYLHRCSPLEEIFLKKMADLQKM